MKIRDDSVFWWHRTPDPAWQRQLARIAPRREHLSHLVIGWYAGDPTLWTNQDTGHQFVNGQRWVIHEAVPSPYVLDLVHRVWDMDYRSSDVGMARRWAQEGYVLTPFWTIQGDDRGHPYRYSQAEAETMQALGQPDKAPLVGELPYAEPSDRTWALLAQRSLLFTGDRLASMWERQMARRLQMERQRRQAVIDLANETSDITKDASDIIWDEQVLSVRRDRDDPRARFADASETDAHYLETGVVDATPGAH